MDKTLTGIGDLFARVKWSLNGDSGGDLSSALSLYRKLPTARHSIGDRMVKAACSSRQSNLAAGWRLGFSA